MPLQSEDRVARTLLTLGPKSSAGILEAIKEQDPEYGKEVSRRVKRLRSTALARKK